MYVRLPDLLAELDLAKVQENYRKRINQYIKCDLLILDEWLLIGTNNAEQQDILRDIVFIQQYSALSLMLQDGTASLVEVL